jgi:hypothetical protein
MLMTVSLEAVYAFRRNVMQVRQGLAGLVQSEPRSTDRGPLSEASRIARYKNVAIPVRRALNPTDRVSAATTLAALRDVGGLQDLADVERAWSALQAELDSSIAFGNVRVPRRTILGAFLNAAALYDPLDRDATSRTFLDEWGTAGEAMGSQLAEDAARVLIRLDVVAAAALGEPELLPPPTATPPPPPDPKEPLWKQLFALIRPEKRD